MADVQPLRALHYDPEVTGGLAPVVSPPYDVIDPAQRAELAARSPYNVVHVDLPEPDPVGDPAHPDRYAHAAEVLRAWRAEGAVVQDDEPAVWALVQDYTAPDGRRLSRRGFFAAVRVEDYGPGRIRPHERTHPGPKEDRLRLTRATEANLSPIFSLYGDPELRAWRGARAGDGRRALGRGHRRGRDHQPPLARRRPRGDRRRPGGARRRGAAHRRRPPPLRDRARPRRGGRGRGPAPLRAHVPRRARGRGPDDLPDPPPRRRAGRRPRQGRAAHRDAARELRHRRGAPRGAAPARRPDAVEPADDGLPRRALRALVPADAQGPGHRRPRAGRPPRALPAARHRRPRGARARGPARADRGRHQPPARASATRARTRRRSTSSSTARTTPPSSCAGPR